MKSKTLVVFLRGINVGGHRRFRPTLLAKKLKKYDVVNIGATGIFVVRKPGPQKRLHAELLKHLPFAAHIVFCKSQELIRLAVLNPFKNLKPRKDQTKFISILSKKRHKPLSPTSFPVRGQWFVQIIGSKNQFVFGVYKRNMKTIGYLGQLDKIVGAPVTTRNWDTINAIVKILNG